MIIAFTRVNLDTDGPDREGVLAFDGDVLLAVLVQLSDLHGELEGRWSIEACFFKTPPRHSYGSLDEAGKWLAAMRLRHG